MKKAKYRQCSYCGRIVPPDYNLSEHKAICKNVHKHLIKTLSKK